MKQKMLSTSMPAHYSVPDVSASVSDLVPPADQQAVERHASVPRGQYSQRIDLDLVHLILEIRYPIHPDPTQDRILVQLKLTPDC
jgi:hypothetical protein